uniref:Uncharacterized protein n=1 Tax=Panagrolaimus sp. ES5 TaxID=591445 RepID=A0AC34G8R0_9BILA
MSWTEEVVSRSGLFDSITGISDDSVLSVASLSLNDNDEELDSEIDYKKIEKYDLTQAFLHVQNIKKCTDQLKILPKRPLFPPNTPGVYMYIINGNTTGCISDVYPDALQPWKQPRYYDVGMSKNPDGTYHAVQRPKKPQEYTGRLMQADHEKYPISKKVISATSTAIKKPLTGTFVVLIYEVKAAFELPDKPKTPPMSKTVVAEAKSLLYHNTAKGTLNHIMDNYFMGDDPSMIPTVKQLENIASNMEDRTPVRPQGAPRHENREFISKMIQDNIFVKAHHITPITERILCYTDASLALLEKSLLPKNVLVNLAREASTIKNSGLTMRLENAKRIIGLKDYEDLLKASIFSIDTTFLLSRLYVTIMMFTAPHIFNDDNEPAKFVGAIMLHKHKGKEDYEWMATELNKVIKSNGKFARSWIRDMDHSLDAFKSLI